MDKIDVMPLLSKAKIDHILPTLKCCKKKREPTFHHDLQIALLNELKLPVPETVEEIEADPFLLLGYGVNAYFSSLTSVIKMFAMVSWAHHLIRSVQKK